jgi:hypothetical protein
VLQALRWPDRPSEVARTAAVPSRTASSAAELLRPIGTHISETRRIETFIVETEVVPLCRICLVACLLYILASRRDYVIFALWYLGSLSAVALYVLVLFLRPFFIKKFVTFGWTF